MAGLGGDISYGAAPRRHRPLHQRCAAGFLTGLLYAGLVVVFIRGTVIHAVRAPQPDTLVRLDENKPKPPPVIKMPNSPWPRPMYEVGPSPQMPRRRQSGIAKRLNREISRLCDFSARL